MNIYTHTHIYIFSTFHHQMGPTPEPGRKTDF